MFNHSSSTARIYAAVACACCAWAFSQPAAAQLSGNPVKAMLGQASDQALDRLSQPGAFSADQAVRIALPGMGGNGNVGKLMDLAGKSGMMGDINAQLNRAAEKAAGEAKPIFRAAIDRMTFKDGMAMARSSTGATDYLKQNTQSEIEAKLMPLVRSALQQSGALSHSTALSAVGMGEDSLTKYVADKTTQGIFTYVGQEEIKARQDPIGTGKLLLQGLGGMKF
jgi:hypothetical protein